MDHKIGVYLCSGCHIGDALDMAKLEKIAKGEQKIPLCRTHSFLCEREGVQLIREDIEKEAVNTVVIAACTGRVNTDAFSFGPAIVVERVNLREYVAWSQKPKDEDTQMLAEDYLRMGIAKSRKVEPPEPHIVNPARSVLVVGGGISGLNAALDVARTGYGVHLVEREFTLGGRLRTQFKTFAPNPPYTSLIASDPEELIRQINQTPGITVHTGCEIESISGSPGDFKARLKKGDSAEEVVVGALIMATGSKPYDAAKLGHLGYGIHANVVTGYEFETMAKKGQITRPSDGKPARNVVFIQCAGSRDPNHLPYCSSSCCVTSLKQATYIREKYSDARVYIVYKDIRTPGHFEDFYKKVQQDNGIFLTKGEISSVQPNGGEQLMVSVEKTLLGEDIVIGADLVVLATGMIPNASDGETMRIAQDKLKAAQKENKEKEAIEAQEVLAKLAPPILNLTYRQGPDLPQLKYGFPDSHFICFPYETRRTGIYTCGTVRKAMHEVECYNDATGAALKAIQCIEMLARGEAVHPRSGDQTFPDLFFQRCTSCKRCTEECPFGTYDEDEKGTPLPNITRCRRCGICMGSCPERIISFKNYSVDMIGSMVKVVEIPEEDEEKPRIIAFICENDAQPVVDMVGRNRLQLSPFIRFIPIRCLGSFNIVWIADSLSKGIDGIMLLGCKHGDDYQCHFIKGSELADYRMGKVKETLDRLVLESDRIRVTQIGIDEFDKLPGMIMAFQETLEKLGPNPYKSF